MKGRQPETMERDGFMLAMYHQGYSYEQIARKFSVSASTAFNGVRRAIRDQFKLEADEQRVVEEERLNYLIRQFSRMMHRTNYIVGVNGKVAVDPRTGEPLTDDGPARQAGLAMLKASESKRKLLGLDQPVRHRVEITDKMDEEIERLAADLAANGPAAPPSAEQVSADEGTGTSSGA